MARDHTAASGRLTMRVLHVIGSLIHGGAEAILYRLVTAPSDVEHHVVSVGPPAWYSERLEAHGIRVYHLNARSQAAQIAASARLYRIIRDVRPDVVQGWMYLSNVLAGFAGKAAGVPVVWGIHCAYFDNLSPAARRLVRLSGVTAGWLPTRVVNCSEFSARAHDAIGFKKAAVDVVPNGCDVDLYSPDESRRQRLRSELGVADGCFLIGTVARWHMHKDHRNLVIAMGLMRGKPAADWRCLLVGPWMDSGNSELQSLLHSTGQADRFICLGSRADVPDIMRALDLHVLPSMEESFPNAVGEAMASGTPCVATDVGDTRLIIGDTGWTVPPRDSPALAQAIAEALAQWESADSWESRRSAARERIVRHFSLGRMVEDYASVWAKAAAGDRQRRG